MPVGSITEGFRPLLYAIRGAKQQTTKSEKQPLADIFFQKLFGKRRASLNGGFYMLSFIYEAY
jgi:hypothetical protein